jgi:dihydrofolate synthase/folylpolyglutamate synthase
MQVSSFDDINIVLKDFVPGSIQDGDFYNPDKMYEILPLLGSPQEKLNIVHIAGTSGKTSTSYYVAGLLSTAGAKVGLSVSPHIFQINERIQINLMPLSEPEMCSLFNEFCSIPGLLELKPTYFEFLIAFAFWTFVKQGCTHAVIEVGLGGLKDATNVIKKPNKVSVITDIGLDHTRILGDTIEKIAFQKAGIIQPQNEVFCYKQDQTVDKVIDEQITKQQGSLHRLNQDVLEQGVQFIDNLPLYQKRNWLLAKQVAEFVIQRDKLQQLSSELLLATQKLTIPARMQKLEVNGKTVILDGAHNPQKLTAFHDALKNIYPGKTFALLMAFMESKQETLEESLQILRSLSGNVVLTEFAASTDLPHKVIAATELEKSAKQAGFITVKVVPDANKAFDELLAQAADIYVITGSFYLIGSLASKVRQYTHG